MAVYVDSSAFFKLIVVEAHSDEFRSWVGRRKAGFVSSELLRTEVQRAVRRRLPALAVHARDLLQGVELVAVTSKVCDDAAFLDPQAMRSLDAIHLATALALGDDLEGVVTYDQRLAEACTAYGLKVVAPGAA